MLERHANPPIPSTWAVWIQQAVLVIISVNGLLLRMHSYVQRFDPDSCSAPHMSVHVFDETISLPLVHHGTSSAQALRLHSAPMPSTTLSIDLHRHHSNMRSWAKLFYCGHPLWPPLVRFCPSSSSDTCLDCRLSALCARTLRKWTPNS